MWSSLVGFSIARTDAEPDSCRRADGVRAATINSDNIAKWTEVEAKIKQMKSTFCSFLQSAWLTSDLGQRYWVGFRLHVSLVVVDEGSLHFRLGARLSAALSPA